MKGKKTKSKGEVWVWAEQRAGRLMPVSLELLSKGKELADQLGTQLIGILVGDQLASLAQELIDYGTQKLYLIENQRLRLYQSEAYARLLAELVREHQPEIFLLGATTIGMDLAPRVAAKTNTGLTAHCADLYLEEVAGKKKLIAAVPGWGGSILVKIVCPVANPQMATVRPGVFEQPGKSSGKKGEIIRVNGQLREEDFQAETVELVETKPTGRMLEEAEIVVGGGWGFQSVGGFRLVEELAEVLGGVTAGTRPAVDAGWVKEDRMIGSSGKTVSPSCLLAQVRPGPCTLQPVFSRRRSFWSSIKIPRPPSLTWPTWALLGI